MTLSTSQIAGNRRQLWQPQFEDFEFRAALEAGYAHRRPYRNQKLTNSASVSCRARFANWWRTGMRSSSSPAREPAFSPTTPFMKSRRAHRRDGARMFPRRPDDREGEGAAAGRVEAAEAGSNPVHLSASRSRRAAGRWADAVGRGGHRLRDGHRRQRRLAACSRR